MLLRLGDHQTGRGVILYHDKVASSSFHLEVRLFTVVFLSRPGCACAYFFSICHPFSVYFTALCIGTNIDIKYC